MTSHLLYLLLNGLTLAGPLARSFEPRVHFNSRWFALFPALGTTGLLFIVWDVLFTRAGVWGFDSRYLVGASLFGLPVEEWLFFFTVPYACIFLYDCMNQFWPLRQEARWPIVVAATLGAVALLLCTTHWDRLYTSITCGLSCVCMAWAVYWRPRFLAAFLRAYAVSLVPFFLVNGILTGALTAGPIVWYDDRHNSGLRMGTIPVEDAFYLLPLLWLTTAQYERRLANNRLLTPADPVR